MALDILFIVGRPLQSSCKAKEILLELWQVPGKDSSVILPEGGLWSHSTASKRARGLVLVHSPSWSCPSPRWISPRSKWNTFIQFGHESVEETVFGAPETSPSGYFFHSKLCESFFAMDAFLNLIDACMQTEQTYADEQSRLINKAYNVLKDPLTRSLYLVCRLDIAQVWNI